MWKIIWFNIWNWLYVSNIIVMQWRRSMNIKLFVCPSELHAIYHWNILIHSTKIESIEIDWRVNLRESQFHLSTAWLIKFEKQDTVQLNFLICCRRIDNVLCQPFMCDGLNWMVLQNKVKFRFAGNEFNVVWKKFAFIQVTYFSIESKCWFTKLQQLIPYWLSFHIRSNNSK